MQYNIKDKMIKYHLVDLCLTPTLAIFQLYHGLVGWVMVFNATFNNISVISWQAILLVEETGVPEENHRQTLSRNVVLSTPHHAGGLRSQH
jgi:hypothetical protein